MMYLKPKKKVKRKTHKQSILHRRDGTCYLCRQLNYDWSRRAVECHHIFDGPRRDISEANGFTVYLCREHHTAGPEAVHNNAKNMLILQQHCQRKYEQLSESLDPRADWMELIGKSYL